MLEKKQLLKVQLGVVLFKSPRLGVDAVLCLKYCLHAFVKAPGTIESCLIIQQAAIVTGGMPGRRTHLLCLWFSSKDPTNECHLVSFTRHECTLWLMHHVIMLPLDVCVCLCSIANGLWLCLLVISTIPSYLCGLVQWSSLASTPREGERERERGRERERERERERMASKRGRKVSLPSLCWKAIAALPRRQPAHVLVVGSQG